MPLTPREMLPLLPVKVVREHLNYCATRRLYPRASRGFARVMSGRCIGTNILPGLYGRIVFAHPVVSQVSRYGQDLDLRKPHLLQRLKGRPDVRTLVPRAAAAVEDTPLAARQAFCPLLQVFQALRLRGGAMI